MIGAGAGAAAALIIVQVAVEGTHIAFAACSEFTLGVREILRVFVSEG